MGSPLGPTLANILITELEDDIIRPLITSDKLKFYVRYVDDTLVLAKPEDIPLILDKLNSFHPQIQFTYEEFVDHNDVHFLDIKFDSQGTTIYRKSTHTGQYRHYSSFTPWSRKVAWIRALVHRATKICSTQQLLQLEILNIKRFASGNGFPRWICDKLINTYSTSQSSKTTPCGKEPEPTIPVIWIRLPFIGQKGNFLLRNCTRKIYRLLKQPMKPQNATVSLLKKILRRNPTKAQSCINLSAQGVMHPTSGKRTGACTLGLMNTRSQINLKSIIMCMIASILNMFFPY